MKTDKKSRVPLFTFPPPLLAALFLLAGCHYKALQGMVWAIGVGHRARWRSPMFQTPWHAHTFTHTRTYLHPAPPAISVTHTHAHTHTCIQVDTHTYICIYVHWTNPNAQTLNICSHSTYTHIYSTLTNICGQTYTRLDKGTCTQTCTRVRPYTHAQTHVHTGFRRNTGTHRKF